MAFFFIICISQIQADECHLTPVIHKLQFPGKGVDKVEGKVKDFKKWDKILKNLSIFLDWQCYIPKSSAQGKSYHFTGGTKTFPYSNIVQLRKFRIFFPIYFCLFFKGEILPEQKLQVYVVYEKGNVSFSQMKRNDFPLTLSYH